MTERESFPSVICWDLDETIGRFIDSEPPVGLRHGIRDALRQLSERGFLHYITTSGTEEHARNALTRAGLLTLYINPLRIWQWDVVMHRRGGGKEYGGIEEGAYFDDETQSVYPHKMLVIGDSLGDQPADLKYLVFIHDQSKAEYDAQVLLQIIDHLLGVGEGSFKNGFDSLFNQGELIDDTQIHRLGGEKTHQRKRYSLPSGITMVLSYGDWHEGRGGDADKSYPIITEIQAESFIREVEPLSLPGTGVE